MKRFSRMLFAALLAAAVASPAFANQCPKLWKQANDKMATMDMNSEQVKKAKALIEESEKAHKAGNHPESEQKAQEAINLLGA